MNSSSLLQITVEGSFCFQVVAPKKEKLAGAEAELKLQMDKLNEKRAELKQVSSVLPIIHAE